MRNVKFVKYMVVLIVILTSVALGWGLKSLQQKQANNAAENPASKLMEAIIAGNISNEYNNMSSMYKNIANAEQTTNLVKPLKGYKITAKEASFSETNGNFFYYLEPKTDNANSPRANVTLVTEKDKGTWRVIRILPSFYKQ